jgi:hypothetical protein
MRQKRIGTAQRKNGARAEVGGVKKKGRGLKGLRQKVEEARKGARSE